MSTDPVPSDARAVPSPGRARPGSGLVARLLTVVYALVITPIATGLISYGGSGWLQLVFARGYDNSSLGEQLAGPFGMELLASLGGGTLLLGSVVLTGIASSAGLLSVGVIGLGGLALAAVPGLLLEFYRVVAAVLPVPVLDGVA